MERKICKVMKWNRLCECWSSIGVVMSMPLLIALQYATRQLCLTCQREVICYMKQVKLEFGKGGRGTNLTHASKRVVEKLKTI